MRKLLLLLAAAALLAGCGSSSRSSGGGGSSSGGAQIAPATTSFLLSLDTAFDSSQWQTLDALLKKIPNAEKLSASIGGKGVNLETDVKPALGPETDLLALNGADLNNKALVGLTQPADQAKFEALLAKRSGTKPVTKEVDGWQVVADKAATIARFEAARSQGTLADNADYKAAMSDLPSDALATLYVSGGPLTAAIDKRAKTGSSSSLPGIGSVDWVSGAVTAVDNGFTVDLRVKSSKELQVSAYKPQLPAEVPADVALFVDFKGLDSALEQAKSSPALKNQLGGAEAAIGGLLDEVIALFKNEGAFYVQTAGSSTAYVLVLEVDDTAAAQGTLDKIGTLVGALSQKPPKQVSIGGATVSELALGAKTTIDYGIVAGKLVISNSEAAIRDLAGSSERLADSQPWKDATSAAGMPDQVAGILYADVQSLEPVLEKLQASSSKSSGSTSKPMSPEAKQALQAFGTALLYGAVDGDVATAKGSLSLR